MKHANDIYNDTLKLRSKIGVNWLNINKKKNKENEEIKKGFIKM